MEAIAVADAIHQAIVETSGIAVRDRSQTLTQHDSGAKIAPDAGLGFTRTAGVVMIQVFTQRGCTPEAKEALCARICLRLNEVGVLGEDIFIGYVENGPDDWSFGFGTAQYTTGELAVPAKI